MTDENNSEILYCYNHPKRETHLRCNNCNRPICSSCAVLTPTGYRCKECVRGQQKKFDTTRWWDYPVAALAAFFISAVGSYFVSMVGFFTLLLAPLAGMAVAEATRFLVHRRRSRALPVVIATATFVGGIVSTFSTFILVLLSLGQLGLSSLLALIWPLAYAILAASTAFYRSRGITL